MSNGAGKGDTYRKVDSDKYSKGWDRTFSKEFKQCRERLELLEHYHPEKINLFRLRYESINTKEEAAELLKEIDIAVITA